MLEPFADEIWLSDGPVVSTAGFRYPTRMAVVRLSDASLFVWSPTSLSPDLRAEVDALGPVRYLVAPNALHHLFMGEWASAYPDAIRLAAPGLRRRRPDLAIHRELTDAPDRDWSDDLDQVVVRGNAITTEVVFFHRRSGTVLFTDLLQQFGRTWFRGWRAVVARVDLMTQPEAEVPRKFRNAFLDRRVARMAIRRILAWPARNIVMAHGAPITQAAADYLPRRFRWLRV